MEGWRKASRIKERRKNRRWMDRKERRLKKRRKNGRQLDGKGKKEKFRVTKRKRERKGIEASCTGRKGKKNQDNERTKEGSERRRNEREKEKEASQDNKERRL